jgi:CubicO group peptidase (beta-lactamase class C family)
VKKTIIKAVLNILIVVILFSCNNNYKSQISSSDTSRIIDSLLYVAVKNNEIPGASAFIVHLGYGFQDEKYNALIIKNNISEGFEEGSRTSLENIQRLARIPLLCDPGEKYIYSLSYDVLSVIIEKVTGLRFDKYVTKYILTPLGMYDSYFIIPEEKQERLVNVYQPAPNGDGLEPTTYQHIEIMLSKQTRFNDGTSDQGFAAWVTNVVGASEGPMSKGSFGFGGFYDTYSWADPEEDFVAILLMQMYPNNRTGIHQKFQNIVYGVIDDL